MFGHDFYVASPQRRAATAAGRRLPREALHKHTPEETAAIDRWLARHQVTRCPSMIMAETEYLALQVKAGELLQRERQIAKGDPVAAPVADDQDARRMVIRREWPQGTPLKTIAGMVGLASSTVSAMAAEMGLPRRIGKPPPTDPARVEIVKREWPLGTPRAKIAEMCDCTEQNIGLIVNRLGLPRRPAGGLRVRNPETV